MASFFLYSNRRSEEIMEMLKRFNQQEGITIVMVTHEAEMAAYADRRVHFQDGRIAASSQAKATG